MPPTVPGRFLPILVIVNVGLPSLLLAASGSLSIERSSQRKVLCTSCHHIVCLCMCIHTQIDTHICI